MKNIIFTSVLAAFFLFPTSAENTADDQPIDYDTAYKLWEIKHEV